MAHIKLVKSASTQSSILRSEVSYDFLTACECALQGACVKHTHWWVVHAISGHVFLSEHQHGNNTCIFLTFMECVTL
jgi:hypothetical protein